MFAFLLFSEPQTAAQKGRDPITPSFEAPRSAHQESASSHAQGWAQALRLGLLMKIRGFRTRPAAEATQVSILM